MSNFTPNRNPAGSPDGGQFATGDGRRLDPGQVLGSMLDHALSTGDEATAERARSHMRQDAMEWMVQFADRHGPIQLRREAGHEAWELGDGQQVEYVDDEQDLLEALEALDDSDIESMGTIEQQATTGSFFSYDETVTLTAESMAPHVRRSAERAAERAGQSGLPLGD